MAMSLFVLIFPSFYIFLSSPEYGYVAYLACVFGSMRLLRDCPPDDQSPEEKEGQVRYAVIKVFSTLFAVIVMTCVDLVMATARASEEAADAYMDFIKSSQETTKLFLYKSELVALERKSALRSKLDDTAAKAIEGAKEPRFWRKPFNGDLFHKLYEKGDLMWYNLQNMEWALMGFHVANKVTLSATTWGEHKQDLETKNPVFAAILKMLQGCPSFAAVSKHITRSLGDLQTVVESVVHHSSEREIEHLCRRVINFEEGQSLNDMKQLRVEIDQSHSGACGIADTSGKNKSLSDLSGAADAAPPVLRSSSSFESGQDFEIQLHATLHMLHTTLISILKMQEEAYVQS